MKAGCFWTVFGSTSVLHRQHMRSGFAMPQSLFKSMLLLVAAFIASCAPQQPIRHRAIAQDPPPAAESSRTGRSLNELTPWHELSAPATSSNDKAMRAKPQTSKLAETPADRQEAPQESFQADRADQTEPLDQDTTPYDPLSTLNQKILAFNVFFDDHVGKPAGRAWAFVVPYPARLHIRTFFRNTAEPKNMINCMLQSRFHDAGVTVERFTLNSTLGVAGFFDVAQDWFGLERKATDFGLTEAHHSVNFGPYLMAPVGGPTSLRDAAGSAIDGQFNALVVLAYLVPSIALLPITAGLGLIAAVNERSLHLDTFDDVNRYTIDLYGAIQDYYYQRRNHDESPPGSSE